MHARHGTPVERFMTRAPITIAPDQSLERAHTMMRSRRVRHLPVLRGQELVGIVSHRDLMLIETLPGVDAREVPVEDAMTRDIYAVAPSTAVAEVAAHMAERKLGSAVVRNRQGRVVGVFTVTDACRALAALTGATTGRRSSTGSSRSTAPKRRPPRA
jgi:acetoin utilization protein AcuB